MESVLEKEDHYLNVAKAVAEECGVRTWEFRQPWPSEMKGIPSGSSSLGFAEVAKRHIVCRKPRDLHSLYLWLHECGHVRHRHGPRVADYWAEYQACRFALEELDRRGFTLTAALLCYVHNYVPEPLKEAMGDASRRKQLARSFKRILEVESWLEAIRAKGEALETKTS